MELILSSTLPRLEPEDPEGPDLWTPNLSLPDKPEKRAFPAQCPAASGPFQGTGNHRLPPAEARQAKELPISAPSWFMTHGTACSLKLVYESSGQGMGGHPQN